MRRSPKNHHALSRYRLILLAALALGLAPNTRAGDIDVDAGRGPVSVHVPAGYDPEVPMPLVMLLHGYGGNGASQESYMQFTSQADARGFLYLHPDGTVDGSANRFWNATDACCDFFGSGVDDSGYLRSLIEAVRQVLNVDDRRIYLIGHSNGGFMSYRMACDHPDLITAIASLAGATWNNPAACAPASGVHVLQMHGTSDNTVLFNGGNFGGALYPGAIATVEQWANFSGCSLIPDNSAPPLDLDLHIVGNETTVSRYVTECSDDGSAELWTINGGGHVPAPSNAFAPAVVDYLFDHARTGLGNSYCSSAPNSVGAGAHIAGIGSYVITDEDFTLIAEGVPPSVFGLFFYGPNEIQAPFGDGFRCIGGQTQRLYPLARANSFGSAARAIDLATSPAVGQIVPSSTWKFQLWYRDQAGPGGSGYNLTDGLSVSFQ